MTDTTSLAKVQPRWRRRTPPTVFVVVFWNGEAALVYRTRSFVAARRVKDELRNRYGDKGAVFKIVHQAENGPPIAWLDLESRLKDFVPPKGRPFAVQVKRRFTFQNDQRLEYMTALRGNRT